MYRKSKQTQLNGRKIINSSEKYLESENFVENTIFLQISP